MRILAGDIGGTNTRLAVVEMTGNGARPRVLEERRFRNRDHPGLHPILQTFLTQLSSKRPTRAAFGVACPVIQGRCDLTNLDWSLDEAGLRERLGVNHARILNDFDAVAHAIDHLGPDDVVELQGGRGHSGKNRSGVDGQAHVVAILGAGTGLGVGFVTGRPGARRVHRSEGGHVDFAARTEREDRLRRHLALRHGRVSWERVLSGEGLAEIYRFIVGEEDVRDPFPLAAPDLPARVSSAALDASDPVAVDALDLFVSAYGAQAGNLALTLQTEGGVYVAGGIAPRIIPRLQAGGFMEAFRDKSPFETYLQGIPVRVIVHPSVGLVGAAAAVASPDADEVGR